VILSLYFVGLVLLLLKTNYVICTSQKFYNDVTTQISFGDSEVESTETFARKNSGSIGEIGKDVFEALIDFRSEGEIVDEDDG